MSMFTQDKLACPKNEVSGLKHGMQRFWQNRSNPGITFKPQVPVALYMLPIPHLCSNGTDQGKHKEYNK